MQAISSTVMSNLTPEMTLMIDQTSMDSMQVIQLSYVGKDVLPDSIAILVETVAIGMTRLELMMKASRKGLHPVWHIVSDNPFEGLLTLYFNDKQWPLYCQLKKIELH